MPVRIGHNMAQSHNILIGNAGLAGETNTIRIGTNGTHTSAYMAGVYGKTVGVTNGLVVVDNLDKVGMATPALGKTKFLYIQQSNAANQIGDASVYQLGSSVALTKIFDANNDMTTGGVFTAPSTGYYNFNVGVVINNLLANTPGWSSCANGTIKIVVNATATYQETTMWPMLGAGNGKFIAGCDQQGAVFTCFIQMNAGDVARFYTSIASEAPTAKTAGVGPIGTNTLTTNATFISCSQEI